MSNFKGMACAVWALACNQGVQAEPELHTVAARVAPDRGKLLPSVSTENARFGTSAAGLGDIDGDGYDDFIVGTTNAEVFVYHGAPTGLGSEVSMTGGAGFGTVVSAAGDVDADGYADVWIGAHLDEELGTRAGAVHLAFGGPSGLHIDRQQKLFGELTIGETMFGLGVSSAGDVNGDGHTDGLIRALLDDQFRVHLHLGDGLGVDPLPAATLVPGSDADKDGFGTSLASLGDVDADGFDDFAVGVLRDGAEHGSHTGAVLLFYGSAAGLDPARGHELVSPHGSDDDWFGVSVASAGDVNLDGYRDVVVGAPYQDADEGAVYVFYGTPAGIDGAWFDEISAPDPGGRDRFGFKVASGGDFDRDGFSDILIGSLYHSHDGHLGSGGAYLCLGRRSGIGPTHELVAAGVGSAHLGSSVSSADLNGDGHSDLLIGAYEDDERAHDSGALFVIRGE
jgi:hypothetical protein